MRGIRLKIYGDRAHFKRPETNNNPCSYSYMHKIALLGFIGAVTGTERKTMSPLYPQLCEDLLYSIRLLTPIIKESFGFTKRKTPAPNFYKQDRRYCEYLRDPSYEITVAIRNDRSANIFDTFCKNIKDGRSPYPTYFGVANCPCVFEYIGDVTVSEEKTGEFSTDAIFSAEHKIVGDTDNLSLSFERVPTYSEDMYYHPDKMVQTVCVQGDTIKVCGAYRTISGDKTSWFM